MEKRSYRGAPPLSRRQLLIAAGAAASAWASGLASIRPALAAAPTADAVLKDLLDGNKRPTDQHIKQALNDHLCRCAAHTRIVRAVQRAAKEMA